MRTPLSDPVQLKVAVDNKTCPRCGAHFTCNGDNDCWCENMHLHKKEMLYIAQHFSDCLCPKCLSSFAEK